MQDARDREIGHTVFMTGAVAWLVASLLAGFLGGALPLKVGLIVGLLVWTVTPSVVVFWLGRSRG